MDTAILLAGGFGSRIKALYPHLPKPMIPIAGRPFLEWAIQYWARQGIMRFVVSLGYLAEAATDYFMTRPPDGLDIATVVEPQPLGTGGAVRFAAQATTADPLVIANGDSLVAADIAPVRALLDQDAIDGAILGVRVADAGRFGSLTMDADGRLTGFAEKRPGGGVINAGVYFLRRRLLARFPKQEPLSMETDVFPALLAGGAKLWVVPTEAPFLDIGTPQSLQEAEEFLLHNFA
jgi:D-glycero-alpha-D-manno-heptose 1-phosphate guanylyltransferase